MPLRREIASSPRLDSLSGRGCNEEIDGVCEMYTKGRRKFIEFVKNRRRKLIGL
jgi:hypothetical protein